MLKLIQQLLRKRERGLTLLELAVVATILAILAALAATGVVGQVSGSRTATKISDIAEVQKAVDGYQSSHITAEFPVKDGDLLTSGSIGILFTSSFTTPEGESKRLVPSFLQRKPKHAIDCAKDGEVVGRISASTTNPDTDCNSAFTGSVPVWQLDENGAVVINLDDKAY